MEYENKCLTCMLRHQCKGVQECMCKLGGYLYYVQGDMAKVFEVQKEKSEEGRALRLSAAANIVEQIMDTRAQGSSERWALEMAVKSLRKEEKEEMEKSKNAEDVSESSRGKGF